MTILFDSPEFYPQNHVVLRAEGPHGLYVIVSEGARDVLYKGNQLTDARDFRDTFPDGQLPDTNCTEFVWRYNGWFAVYDNRNGDSEVMGEPMFSLADAVSYALDLAYGEL